MKIRLGYLKTRSLGKLKFPPIEIAEILGYKNPRDAVKRHCVNEFPYVVKHDVGINTGLAVQTIQKKYINEGSLYRLIAKSKFPEAREFESLKLLHYPKLNLGLFSS